jgi:PAS domain S-box-containing protein
MTDQAGNSHPLPNRRPKPGDTPNGIPTPIIPIANSGLSDAIKHGGRVYQLMVDSVRDYAIFMLDPAGYIASWNQGAKRIKGYEPDEIIGRHFSVFYTDDANAIGHPQHELDIATKEGRFEEEGWRVRKDGSLFWANVLITAVRDDSGELIGFAKVTRDLTERRNAEQRALADARRLAEAESANAAKAEFLTAMSHELRTPLNAIGGYTELLILGLGGPITAEQTDYLERIRRSQQHLMGIISDLLNFSRIEAGHLTYDISQLSLIQVIDGVVPLVEAQAIAKGVKVIIDPPEGDCVALGDRSKVDQILLNLLTNAVKFNNNGGTITTRCSVDETTASISVTDTGIGIPTDKLEAIFEPFVQLGRSLSSAHEGTGLGLAISRDLARAMSGNLSVVSTPRAGSTFTLILPRPLTPRAEPKGRHSKSG